MKNYLERLNWVSFFAVLSTALLGALSRKQDETLLESLTIAFVLGIPLSVLFLFVGMDEKEK